MTRQATTPVRIRGVRPDDLPPCAALDHSVTTDYVWQMELGDSDGRLSAGFRTVRLPRSMRVRYPRNSGARQASWDVKACFLVAELGSKIIGYVNLLRQPSESIGWVTDLAVDIDSRNVGIATRLLGEAREWARERDCQRLIAETTTKNYPAISFLQKSGLVFCGYNDLYFENRDIAVFFGQNL